ncbi:MAG: hypothetical protein A2283_21655 [Lentisphaerae bacterium RIFOXYA12_FULL_48_11]|nr:MAG: hypothetical protein A2283_21655 [Lentisphaerae bacterium RIFOXYA12_FULL_48_11]
MYILRLAFLFVFSLTSSSIVMLSAPAPAAPKPAAPAAPAVAKPSTAPAAKKPAAPAPKASAAQEMEEAAAAGEEEQEAEIEDPVDLEIAFMKALIRSRMPDYAQKALDKLVQKNPDAKARASSIKIDILAGVGNYAAAEAMIAALPADALETWIMKLSLAEHYYQAGKMTEAKAGYDSFFKKYEKGPPVGMGKFYMEQAYKYAQMLMFKNEEKAAVEAFRCVLVANPPRDIEFKIRIDLAELCVKLAEKTKDKERDEYFKKAKEACDPVLWKDPGGPLFGKALMILAHMEMIKGDKKAAKKLIDTYMPMLKELEKILKENNISLDFSPMAECRYMLGTILEEEGMALLKQGQKADAIKLLTEALTHFVNVVAKYQTGQWAVPSGNAQDRIVNLMKKEGYDPKIPVFDRSKIMMALLKEAQSQFEQNLFKESATKYLIYINSAPEHDTSVAALGELAKCYMELGDTNYFHVIAGYLAERFCMHADYSDNAGNALLRVAAKADENNNKLLRQKTYNYYIKYFPEHKRAAAVLYQFGETKVKEKNYDQAIDYFSLLTTNALYMKSSVFFPSLSRLAYCYSMMNDYSNAVQVLSSTISVLPPGVDELEARYRLGDTYRRMDRIVPAINEYVMCINAVNGTNKAAYAKTVEDVTKVKSIMESVQFWKAYGYALLNKGFPPEKLKDFQQKAIDDFTKFVADYPKSTLSSTALSRLGSLLYANGKSDDANKVFDRLVKEYPDAPESKDVVFVQGMSLIELKKMDKAIEVFGKMLANEKAFNAPQFLRVGNIMFEAGEYPTAIKFFERAKKLGTKGQAVDRAIWEPAVFGMARSYYAQGNVAEAAKAIEELFAKFQRTPLFADASFILSKSYADMGSKENDKIKKDQLFVKANAAIAKGMTSITNEASKFQANLQIADVQMMQGNKGGATASYFRMLSFGDWDNADIRPFMETALERGLPLLKEKEMLEEVVTIGTKYLEACPRGRLIREVRRARDDAKLKLAMSGKKVTIDTEKAPEAAPAPAVPAADAEKPADKGSEAKAATPAEQAK